MNDTTPPPLTHAQRGAIGGAAQHPAKGFGTPEVIAKAVATRRRKAEARLAEAQERKARVQEITDQYHPPFVCWIPLVDTVLHADVVPIRVPAPVPAPAPAPDPAMDIQIID